MSKSICRLWPDTIDELLLRAALVDDFEAVQFWQDWCKKVDHRNLEFTHQRLLPLLNDNLRRYGVSDPALHQYRAAVRRFWAQNQVLYRHAAAELQSLEALGIPALVLKGVPLSVQYYGHPGLRPMSDIDILIDRSKVAAASKFFLDRGWVCIDEFITNLDNLDDIIDVRHGFNLRGPEDQEIDLHWNIFQTYFADLEPLWNSAMSFDLNGLSALTLSPTDQLLHACSQAAGWNVVRPIRWIPDAMSVIGKSSIDWPYLVENAGRYQLVEPVHDALTVLRDLLKVDIPDEVIIKLKSMPTRFAVKVDYRLSSKRPLPIIGRPLQRYFRYLRIGRPLGLSFNQYMKQLWGVPTFLKLSVLGFKHVWVSAFGNAEKK